MYILGIDTSCDDTSIAILEIKKEGARRRRDATLPNFRFGPSGGGSGIVKLEILSNVVSSQVKLHAKYGGVYPFLAKREHQRNLPLVLKKALTKAKNPKIDLIGVTIGPGLEPCLWQGVNFAIELAKKLKKPVIPVNHIEAHILANFLLSSNFHDREFLKNFVRAFPAICLVVSGGHTQLILMKEIGKYKLIGETRDDAAGECFDKVARILGLGYPGGPIISKLAQKLTKREVFSLCLPRPMIYQKNYDFSFSGLKTAVLYDFRKRKPKIRKSREYIREMCREAQQAIIDVLIRKTIKATKDYKAKAIILGGGVAANEELRKQFAKECSKCHFEHLVPPKNLCTDNAAMVGITAFYHKDKATFNLEKIEANANLKI